MYINPLKLDYTDLPLYPSIDRSRDSKADDGRAKEVAVEGNRKLTTFGQRLMLVANQTNTKLKTWSWREERAARRKTRPVSKQTPTRPVMREVERVQALITAHGWPPKQSPMR